MSKYDDLEELKILIEHNLDVVEFLDLIGVSYVEVIDRFGDEIEENYNELQSACR